MQDDHQHHHEHHHDHEHHEHEYDHEHHRGGVGLVTPVERHAGSGQLIDWQRQGVLDKAYAKHPERFPNG